MAFLFNPTAANNRWVFSKRTEEHKKVFHIEFNENCFHSRFQSNVYEQQQQKAKFMCSTFKFKSSQGCFRGGGEKKLP